MNIKNSAVGQTMVKTMELRFVRREITTMLAKNIDRLDIREILQQLWVSTTSPAEEWRDVPSIVDEDK